MDIATAEEQASITELCRWASARIPGDQSAAKWLDDFSRRLPREQARQQFEAYRAAHPLKTTDRRLIQIWVNDCINATVNAAIGIAPVSMDEADARWGWKKLIVPDRVVCLSLDDRGDRWEAFLASCRRSTYLSQWPIERYRARPAAEMILPDWWPENWSESHYATRQDHLDLIEESHLADHESVLIFEDDAIVQPNFDQIYLAACQDLPADWMGLWLTSDGHQKPPAKISPGLNQSRSQLFLHAYLLSRSGMRRLWSHVTYCPCNIVDGAIANLMEIEPHFYSTAGNAVIQVGDRSQGERTDYFGRYGT